MSARWSCALCRAAGVTTDRTQAARDFLAHYIDAGHDQRGDTT